MSGILFFIVFILVMFIILGIALRLFPKDASFTIAIGAVIGANIYNSTAYPIFIGNFIFGIDSIVYTIFAFCLLFMLIKYGKRDMKIVLYTSLFSIFFTALLFFMGNLSQSGYSTELLLRFLFYIASIIATYFAVLAMAKIFEWLQAKNTNVYISILISLLVVSLVNSLIYFGISYLLTGNLGNTFFLALIGSYIGKAIASLLCLVVFAILSIKKHNKKTPDQCENN